MADRQESRKKLQLRINRIQGQVQAISRMLDEDKYCMDIVTQIAATRSALDSLGRELLADHIESCVLGHGTESEHECASKMTEHGLMIEVRAALERFMK
jgi:CsoR family transcriptional regulator, copper-sensing transcriptional repressor